MNDITKAFESIQPRYPEFKDRVALVTGSTQGIGEGIALRLAREGMKIILHGLKEDEVHNAVQQFRSLGVDVIGFAFDLSLPDAVDKLFEALAQHHPHLDMLVNNAAHLRRLTLEQVSSELLDYQLALNLRAPYLCAVRAAKMMLSAKSGSIINISSVGGQRAHLPGLPYDITKGGLDAMTRAMALDLAGQGIRVNAIAPGAVRTPRTQPDDSDFVKAQVKRIPLGRRGTALEIGAAVAFLASDDAAYITGLVLPVDGGIMAQINPPGQPI